jgi:hypothetical protein
LSNVDITEEEETMIQKSLQEIKEGKFRDYDIDEYIQLLKK